MLIHQGYDTKISVYNGNGSEKCIECELEGVANVFATSSLKLRSRETLDSRRCLTTMSIMYKRILNRYRILQPSVENHQFLHKKGGEANMLPLPKFLGIICFSSCRTLIDLGKQLSHLIDLQYVIIGCI